MRGDLGKLSELLRGSVAVILGDEFCGDVFERWLEGVESYGGGAKIEWARVVRSWVEETLDLTCIATVCPDANLRKVLGRGAVFIYGTSPSSREVPKHCVDEFLKCVVSADAVLVLCLTKPLNIVSQGLVLASSMGKRVVVVSRGVPRELLMAAAMEVLELSCEELAKLIELSLARR